MRPPRRLTDTREELEADTRVESVGVVRAAGSGRDGAWRFPVRGTGFEATLAVSFTEEPEPPKD
jgi:hypothetical protein